MKIKNISKAVLILSLLFTASNMNALSKRQYAALISTAVVTGAAVYYQPEVFKSLAGTALNCAGWLFNKATTLSTYAPIQRHPYISAGTASSLVILSVLGCCRGKKVIKIKGGVPTAFQGTTGNYVPGDNNVPVGFTPDINGID